MVVPVNWRPPYLMQQKKEHTIWALIITDTAFYQWEVYAIGEDGAHAECIIRFMADDRAPVLYSPDSVQKLAKLLKGTHGSGKDEGTLKPTARIAQRMNYAWANIALRPWAFNTVTTYNNRKQVDAGLKKWSRIHRNFKNLYDDIYSLYPKAEQDLSAYYQQEFDKDKLEADTLAKDNLDKVFRMNFVFPK